MEAFNGAVLLIVALGVALWTVYKIQTSPELPQGCWCEYVYPHHGACLACTCPDCGGCGRFGAPIQHNKTCSGPS